MNDTYPIAYVQVLCVLKRFINKRDLIYIPTSVIQNMVEKADKNYVFEFDDNNPYKSLSKKAKSILICLYKEYFLDKDQGKRLLQYLKTLEK